MTGTRFDAWKLTRQQKFDIVRRFKTGEPVCAIAARYDIRPQVVSYHAQMRNLRRRRTATRWLFTT